MLVTVDKMPPSPAVPAVVPPAPGLTTDEVETEEVLEEALDETPDAIKSPMLPAALKHKQ